MTNRFLDVSVEHFGSVMTDENVKIGVRKQKVVSEWAPMTQASRNFSELAHRLVRSQPMIPADGESAIDLAGHRMKRLCSKRSVFDANDV